MFFLNPEIAFKVEKLCGLFSSFHNSENDLIYFSQSLQKKKNYLWAETKHGKFHHKGLIFLESFKKVKTGVYNRTFFMHVNT